METGAEWRSPTELLHRLNSVVFVRFHVIAIILFLGVFPRSIHQLHVSKLLPFFIFEPHVHDAILRHLLAACDLWQCFVVPSFPCCGNRPVI